MGDEEAVYQITKDDGSVGKSSRDYTGKGLAVYINKDTYNGDFVDGVRHGKGKYVYANTHIEVDPETNENVTDTYEGDFFQNNKHGIGKMFYHGKGEYFGHFENGRRHGEGVFKYLNGDYYSGWFKYGKKSGQGTFVFKATGMRLTGEWVNGQISEGEWVFPNGKFYRGKFQNNKPSGQGQWFFKNGNVQSGEYKQEKVVNEDDEEAAPKLKLEFHSQATIGASAFQINALENL